MNSSRPRHGGGAALLLLCLVLAAACSASDASPSRPPPPLATPRAASASISAPFDLAGVMRRAHFAFRPEGDGWIGGHRTYEVSAHAGDFSVMPAGDEHVVPARFETTSIARGGARRAPAQGEPRVDPDGHLAIARGPVVEHLRNDEDGVEQSFELAARPEGAGDLEVRVRVTGQEYAGETPTGHHFADPVTGLGVRYGAATWVDARGERAALDVAWTGEELAITVPEALIEDAAYPAVIDPTVGPELTVDDPIQVAPLADQTIPRMAFDGTNYLAVWLDQRSVTSRTPVVYGARVSQAGVVLDPGGFLIGNNARNDAQPAVAFGGTQYLVVWEAVYTPSFTNYTSIIGARVTTSGAVIDTTPMIKAGERDTSDSSEYVYHPAVTSDGQNFLIAWEQVPDSLFTVQTIFATVVSPTLTTLATATVSAANGVQVDYPAAAFDGTNYLVAWQRKPTGNAWDVQGARVGKTGTVLDAMGFVICNAAADQTRPRLAFDGTNYLAVWADGRLGPSDIYGARINKSAVLLDAAGIAISTAANAQTSPDVAFDGANYDVVWADGRNASTDIYAARVDINANVLDPSGVAVSTGTATETTPAVACATGACLSVWSDQRNGKYEVYGARLMASSVLDPAGIPIGTTSHEEISPAVAFDGSHYLVVWQDRRGASYDIYGARLDPMGTSLDLAGIAISTAAGDQKTPRVTFDGANFLVVWEDDRNAQKSEIYGARVSPAGTVLDPAGLALQTAASISNSHSVPAVASDGTNSLLVWQELRPPSSNTTSYATRVSQAGAVLDGLGLQLDSQARNPQVAFDGTRYLVIWNASTTPVWGRRISTANVSLDATPFFLGSGASSDVASLTYDGLNFFATFSNTSNSGISGVRVTSAGAVIDTTPIPIAPAGNSGSARSPSIGSDGKNSLVAWRSIDATGVTLHAELLDQAGTKLTMGGLIASPSLGSGDYLTSASSASAIGHFLLVYSRGDTTSPYGSHRIRARLVLSQPVGQACAMATDCATGFCVDGFCCNTACGGGSATDCFACSVAAGATANGNCTALTGTSCSDGNGCTQSDTCQAGTCVGGSPVVCTALDACHTAGTCNASTGVCDNPPKANGAACNDGNACTQTDTCQNGACTGTNPVTCPMPDACHTVAACDPSTGMCAVAPKADGTACDDGDACTQGDTCQAGMCTSGSPVVCPAPDQCHTAGTCNPMTGICDNPAKADGTACDDGDACTQADVCTAGACAGAKVVCAALDQCHTAGTCDPSTGMCDNPVKADGASCSDDDACTQGDACKNGVCVAGDPVDCPAKDECHQAGQCNPTNGACSSPKQPDGTPCSGGTCTNGKCMQGGTTTSGTTTSGSTTTGDTTSSSGGGGPGAGGSSGDGGGTPAQSGGCSMSGNDTGSAAPLLGLALGMLAMRRRRRA